MKYTPGLLAELLHRAPVPAGALPDWMAAMPVDPEKWWADREARIQRYREEIKRMDFRD